MKHLRLALALGAVLVGGLAATQFERLTPLIDVAGYEVSPFRREACREAQLAFVDDPAPVVFFGTSRLWAALEEDFVAMPVCARRRLQDERGASVADVHVSLGLRDVSVLYDDIDPLAPQLLIIELDLLATSPFTLSLTARRQALASRVVWGLETLLLGAPEPWTRLHGAPQCTNCFEPDFIKAKVESLDRNLADAPVLRPHHEELLRARAAAGKTTVFLELPRSPALEAGARAHLEPWRVHLRQRASDDPALEYWAPEHPFAPEEFHDESHLGEAGRARARAWLLERARAAAKEGT